MKQGPYLGHTRKLQSALDEEIYKLTHSYLLESVSDPLPNQFYLRQSAKTIGDEFSSTTVSTFQGMIVFNDFPHNFTDNETRALLIEIFDENKVIYLSRVRNSIFSILQQTEDVVLSFTGKMSNSLVLTQSEWYHQDDALSDTDSQGELSIDKSGDNENDTSNNKEAGSLNATVVKSSDKTSLIAGALAGSASLLLFIYAYKRRLRLDKGHEIVDDLGDDHDNDLESRASEDEFQKGLEYMSGTSLRNIAIAGPTHNGLRYIEAVVSSSYVRGSSMSKLASGAVQEKFANTGMKVDTYGSREKGGTRSLSKKRRNKVTLFMNKDTLRRKNLGTDLDPIDEVNSAISGSSTNTPELWQHGNKEINDAPPLLPALSVSSVPSDETPSNDAYNIVQNNYLLDNPGVSCSSQITCNTPLAVPPYDSMDMEGIMQKSQHHYEKVDEYLSPETPLHMRCLSFGSGSDVSEFSSPDRSEENCVNDMAGALNPSNSDSSSDGCVKDIMSSINDCITVTSNERNNSSAERSFDALTPGSQPESTTKLNETEGIIIVDTESLCYSQPSVEDNLKNLPPELYYSDTSGDFSLIHVQNKQ